MLPVALFGVAAIVAVGALAILLGLRRRRARQPVLVASDTGAAPPIVLRDRELGLCGKPDYIIEEKQRGRSQLVVLEVKPNRRARRVYESDAVQVSAYALLLRSAYGDRAAPFGYLRYATMAARVDLTPELERRVSEIVQLIRRDRYAAIVHRSHAIAARCAGCSMRERCDERLA